MIVRIAIKPVILDEGQVVKLGEKGNRKTDTTKPDEPVERLRKLW